VVVAFKKNVVYFKSVHGSTLFLALQSPFLHIIDMLIVCMNLYISVYAV